MGTKTYKLAPAENYRGRAKNAPQRTPLLVKVGWALAVIAMPVMMVIGVVYTLGYLMPVLRVLP